MTPLVWVYTIQNTENSIPQIFTLSSFMMLPCARSAWSWSSHKLISNWLTPVTHHTLLCQHSKRKSKSLFLLQRQCYVICWSWQLADDWGTWDVVWGEEAHIVNYRWSVSRVTHSCTCVVSSHWLGIPLPSSCCLFKSGGAMLLVGVGQLTSLRTPG